jgi:hypothetical protein
MPASLETLKAKLDASSIDTASFSRLGALPDPIGALRVEGGQAAIALWKRLRRLVPETWHWPVLLGAAEERSFSVEGARLHTTQALLAQQSQQVPSPSSWHAIRESPEPEETIEEIDWPTSAPREAWSIPFDVLSHRPLEHVMLALVPTRAPWEVPIYLRFGGWNACPTPTQHASVMRRWNLEFGAEVVGVTHDVVEMLVTRPAATHEAALTLAREQAAYCVDLVDQGLGSVSALAAALYRAPNWYFWWD